MKNLVSNFSEQLSEALIISRVAKLTPSKSKIQNVLICGLGGSGISANIVSDLVQDKTKLPISICKGYFIPSWVNENTLVIASSYSGNTEETLNCLTQAIEKNSKVITITSGGKLLQMSKKMELDHILVPGTMPPRACLGYSMVQLFHILSSFNIINDSYKSELLQAISLIESEKNNIIEQAKTIAQRIKGKTAVIYGTTNYEGVVIRLRQQLNENSKVLCWHGIVPEMNHNELVGWRDKNDNLSVLFFIDKDEYSRNLSRIEINKKVIEKYTNNITEIYSKGNSQLERSIYFIHLSDWISVFLGELRGVDLTEVNVINHLKSELQKLN